MVGTFPVDGADAIAFDGVHMWVTSPGDGTVTELNLSGTIMGTFAAGADPYGIAYDGTHMWVTDPIADYVTVLNADGSVAATFTAPTARSARV